MMQEPFIGCREICYSGFNLYWPKGERKNIRVMTTVKKVLIDKGVINHRTNLIDHPYFMLLEVCEIDSRFKRPGRKVRIINVYDNWIERGCTWDGGIGRTRRALEDINWEPVIRGRVLITGVINAHSPLWNPHCQRRQNAAILEDFINQFALIINKKPGRSTRLTSQGVSVIDLALSTMELGLLTLWEIPKDYPALSDHELILLHWEDINYNLFQPNISKAIGCDIQGLIEDKHKFSKAQKE